MTIKIIDIEAQLAPLPVLKCRGEATTEEEANAAFSALAPYRNGAIFAGSFEGDSGWEKHANGDEVVQIQKGSTGLTVLTDSGPETLQLAAGMLVVVPRNHWHRFNAPDGVTVMTVTPQPTDHSFADDPR